MNKFVKGAKNLAFALSFVTVAACGGVKKADLEALEEKMNKKFDGVGANGEADRNQGYVRKSEINDFVKNDEVKAVQGDIENLKNETKFLDSLNNCKDKEILTRLFGSEALKKFEVFKDYDYKLIFADDGKKFALDVMFGKKKNEGLSVANETYVTVEASEEFKVCKNLGFEGKCFVVNDDSKLSVAAADNDGSKLKVGKSDVTLDVAGKILEKAKALGVDVKKLFNVGDFEGKKLFGVDVSGVKRSEVVKVIGVIADGVDEKNGYVAAGTSIKFKFGGVERELTVANA